MFCKYCGTQISDDAIFCEVCGRQIRHIAPTGLQFANPTAPTPVKKKKAKKVILIIVAILLVGLIGAYTITVSNRTVFISKDQMISSVKGSYKQVVGDGDYYFHYKYIRIKDDKVIKETTMYSAWTEGYDSETEYDITFYSFLTGRIYYGSGSRYLTIDKDGNVIDSYDNRTYNHQ